MSAGRKPINKTIKWNEVPIQSLWVKKWACNNSTQPDALQETLFPSISPGQSLVGTSWLTIPSNLQCRRNEMKFPPNRCRWKNDHPLIRWRQMHWKKRYFNPFHRDREPLQRQHDHHISLKEEEFVEHRSTITIDQENASRSIISQPFSFAKERIMQKSCLMRWCWSLLYMSVISIHHGPLLSCQRRRTILDKIASQCLWIYIFRCTWVLCMKNFEGLYLKALVP